MLARRTVEVSVDPGMLALPWWNPMARLPVEASVAALAIGAGLVVFVAVLRALGHLRGAAGALALVGLGVATLAGTEMNHAFRDGPDIARAVTDATGHEGIDEIDVHALARGQEVRTVADGDVTLVLRARGPDAVVVDVGTADR